MCHRREELELEVRHGLERYLQRNIRGCGVNLREVGSQQPEII